MLQKKIRADDYLEDEIFLLLSELHKMHDDFFIFSVCLFAL